MIYNNPNITCHWPTYYKSTAQHNTLCNLKTSRQETYTTQSTSQNKSVDHKSYKLTTLQVLLLGQLELDHPTIRQRHYPRGCNNNLGCIGCKQGHKARLCIRLLRKTYSTIAYTWLTSKHAGLLFEVFVLPKKTTKSAPLLLIFQHQLIISFRHQVLQENET